ncbi:electron transfer flavoprotein subunit alpha/FixB family protein [uncultured Clostridium sp.]|uniref:electron transfer flavoprotein subunit alpha/FixB family protein n=1 Tax=uncultured Clostridium sp. TaxID=59620 RepID=UPI0026269CCF|nr:electron transfer flavoprotein subunit alpha/FixB family protein [uncultured Clostridium sp.]
MEIKDNIAVLVEIKNNRVSSLSLELLGKGRDLAKKMDKALAAILIGDRVEEFEEELLKYDIDYIYSYEGVYKNASANVYGNIVEEFIKETNTDTLLIGDNDFGKAIATKIAVRFNSGLTVGCVDLDINDFGKLVQRKPISGGLMAEMICKEAKPQILTVKKSVMELAKKVEVSKAEVIKGRFKNIDLSSDMTIMEKIKREITLPIGEAEVLVVAGRGFKNKEDLELAKKLAKKLNGEFATTRPLVEMGWAKHTQQVGISGTIVKPRLIITLGVSGAVQFVLGMDKSDYIVAVNNDKDAPIFDVAHYGLVGDIYEIVPELLK